MDARKGIELLLTPGLSPADWELLETAWRSDEHGAGLDLELAIGQLKLARVPQADIERQHQAVTRAGAPVPMDIWLDVTRRSRVVDWYFQLPLFWYQDDQSTIFDISSQSSKYISYFGLSIIFEIR
jgi:hypothetical protein